MSKKTKAQRLLPELSDWSAPELLELLEMIQGLVEAKEAGESEEPPSRADGTPIGKNGGKGYIELKMIRDRNSGKEYGPYRYLRYWAAGKNGKLTLKSVYVGKAQGAEARKS